VCSSDLKRVALSQGNTLATVLFDSPVVINSAALERLWRPINYSGRFYGEQRMREALVRSMNLASVRLLLDSTGVGNTVRYLEAFGFNDSALPRNGSLALGGGNATPLDMAQAYATIANGGYAVTPYVIDSISGPEGDVLYRANPKIVCRECEIEPDLAVLQEMAAEDMLQAQLELEELEGTNSAAIRDEQTLEDLFPGVDVAFLSAEQLASIAESYRPDANVAPELFDGINAAPRIMSERIAFLIQDAMRSVVRRGTGVRAWRELRRSDLSGKTGTSNDRRDAWFAGFNSFTVGIVWVGFDDDAPLGPREEGSRTALPIWIELMRAILDGTPLSQMDMPEGIITVRINKTSGCPAKATDPYDSVMFEVFREEYVPECDEAEEATSIFNSFEEEVMLPEGLEEDLEEDEEAAEEESIF
jgi:penicillin-binding protein 1A